MSHLKSWINRVKSARISLPVTELVQTSCATQPRSSPGSSSALPLSPRRPPPVPAPIAYQAYPRFRSSRLHPLTRTWSASVARHCGFDRHKIQLLVYGLFSSRSSGEWALHNDPGSNWLAHAVLRARHHSKAIVSAFNPFLFIPTLSALDPSYTPLEELWHRSFLVTPIIDKVLGRECRGILQGQLANSDHHHCTYTVTLRYP